MHPAWLILGWKFIDSTNEWADDLEKWAQLLNEIRPATRRKWLHEHYASAQARYYWKPAEGYSWADCGVWFERAATLELLEKQAQGVREWQPSESLVKNLAEMLKDTRGLVEVDDAPTTPDAEGPCDP